MSNAAEWLVDKLDADLSKRRLELIDLRLLVSTSTGQRSTLLCRACHVMAYAHWEGFAKTAIRLYLDHLKLLTLYVTSLRYELQALAFAPQIRTAANTIRSVADISTALQDLDQRANRVFDVDTKEVVKVGNVTSDNLRLMLQCAGLPYLPGYAMRENWLDTVVCGRRHRIAHGDWQPVSRTEAREVVADVLVLCSELNNQIQTAAVYREYLFS
jgi:MAE_28990/MAE_18760-like HEPN